ncbi:hypothetical protein AMTRI_Chr08g162170 [Amborella trichopoda]|uniref:UPF0161 protein At3g09310 n=1 Tax=Amborella trichopoda TaxID=13333 RepID=UPI0005D2FE4E|nr:UPF0161 protein At3g09310 [Amborella trichopoda]|eukprot:XP_011624116.1 UPF0161 protein At3g09310 [Amborella trichopoda]
MAFSLALNPAITSVCLSSHEIENRNSQISVLTLNFVHKSTKTCRRGWTIMDSQRDSNHKTENDGEVPDVGVKVALSMLRFYKREISPLLPKSCRYIPSCSEYSMEAYKRYGVLKGTVLTAWRLCRCNPLGGSGFDPPRWFDERSPLE